MIKKSIIALAAVVLLAGCATKQYPQLAAVSEAEAAAFDCKDIQLEIIKAESARAEIDRIGEFDGRTVIGFLGDFGMGNGMAKSTAYEKADARLMQLRNLQTAKGCQAQAVQK